MPVSANKVKVSLVTLGCSRNEVDSEELAGRLAADGWELVKDPGEAEVAVEVITLLTLESLITGTLTVPSDVVVGVDVVVVELVIVVDVVVVVVELCCSNNILVAYAVE